MPITKSAQKAHRQSLRRKKRNLEANRKTKKLLKQVRVLVQEKKEEAKKLLPQVYKSLDKMAKTKLMKKNKAARLKSRISKSISKPEPQTNPKQSQD